jgi:hypothetical protein
MAAVDVATVESVITHGLTLVEQIIAEVKSAAAGTLKPDEALARIGTLHQQLLDQRAETDAALHAKFAAKDPA